MKKVEDVGGLGLSIEMAEEKGGGRRRFGIVY